MKQQFKFFALLACTLLISFSLMACGSAPAPDASKENPAADATDQTPKENPAPDVPDKAEAALLELGSVATLDDWEISVTSFEYTKKIEKSYSSFSPDEGSQFVLIYASITNKAKEASTFLPQFSISNDIGAKIMYAGEYEYSSTVLLGYDSDLHDTHLNPLTSKDGVIVFECPDSVINGTEELKLVFSNITDEVEFKLR